MIFLNGFLYIKDNERGLEKRWRCKHKGCKAFIVIMNEDLTSERSDLHTFKSNEGLNAPILPKIKIINKCKASSEAFVNIFTSESSTLQQESLGTLTSYASLRDYTRKVRNQRDNYTRTPNDDVPLALQYTLCGTKFLQFDTGINAPKRFGYSVLLGAKVQLPEVNFLF